MTEETRVKMSTSHMGHKPSPETRGKMSASLMGNTNALGYIQPAEVRAKNSASKMGHPVSPETRAKMSVAGMKRTASPETRVKMSVAKMGKTGALANRWRGGTQMFVAREHARRRTYGFVALNEPFDGSEGHHVDNEQVIYMPKVLHRSIFHRQTDGLGMAQINAIAYNFLFKQEVKAAMAARECARA